ncbi:MAG: methionine gamma-lyase family protein [Lachnospiraceae bacterium]|nr:methionine gamma-lyase family protein [Lachnospiraceae bacterium]
MLRRRIRSMYTKLGLSDELIRLANEIEETLRDRFRAIDRVAEYNQLKVLVAMQKNHLQEAHFAGTTGYGYNDIGREALEQIYADTFHTEAALVRPQITCGTHALSTALFASVRPGDEILFPAGKPYDTLEEVLGMRESKGSLKEWGVSSRVVELLPDGTFDYDSIRSAIRDNTKLVEIQRSKGYLSRKTFSPEEIGGLIRFIKSLKPDVIAMVDNCYGEFVCKEEPSDFGADLTVGSLIKNPGGGLAPSGGYIVGTKECVEQCAYRLTAPGLGAEVGASLGQLRMMIQGFFFAPVVTAAALKTAVFAANLYERLGFKAVPNGKEERFDIIQSIELASPETLKAFCRGIQKASPVDSFVTPEPWDMPGYEDPVIMAAGTFISGSSIELSADGPLRAPYNVFFQGGLTYPHGKYGILRSAEELRSSGLVSLSEK